MKYPPAFTRAEYVRGGDGERRDCSVRAYAVALGIGYDEAHKALAAVGRREHRGAYHWQMDLLPRLQRIPMGTLVAERGTSRGVYDLGTLGSFVARHPTGRFLVGVRGHFLCLVNGVIHDWLPRPKRSILGVWKVLEDI